MDAAVGVLVIACGALRKLNDWPHLTIQCLPADLHNRPEKIPAAVREKIQTNKGLYASIFVAFADCGTGGLLDTVLTQEQVERIPGAHCYEFFAGSPVFAELAAAEPGTFYLTDFLLRHFDRLVIHGLGIDRYPELLQQYFGNYRRLVYLAQIEEPQNIDLAREAAKKLGLDFEYKLTGYGELGQSLRKANEKVITWQN